MSDVFFRLTKFYLIGYFLCLSVFLQAQVVTGELSLYVNQPIKLEGFNGFNTYPISSTITDNSGNFKLSYSKEDYGIGYVITSENHPIFIILNEEGLELIGESITFDKTIAIKKGQETQLLYQYSEEHERRYQALRAWDYLVERYTQDSLFSVSENVVSVILSEKQRLIKEDSEFLNALPQNSYVSWYVPIRKLVTSVSDVALYHTDAIPEIIETLRKTDYTDSRLYKSGLFSEVLDAHFWLLENSGQPFETILAEMQESIDVMLPNLIKDEKKFNEVVDYLFNLLEKHSFFQVSEYLALKVLNEVSCTIDGDLSNQLEIYRAMKTGKVAPDIVFSGETFFPNHTAGAPPTKLSEMETNYTAVVFAASWCPACKEEIPSIVNAYNKWRTLGVEVVLVSLDYDREAYREFVKDIPFISTCDFQKWESTIAKAYYVFATPTIYLLDKNRNIVLRPNYVQHLDAWIEQFLGESDEMKK